MVADCVRLSSSRLRSLHGVHPRNDYNVTYFARRRARRDVERLSMDLEERLLDSLIERSSSGRKRGFALTYLCRRRGPRGPAIASDFPCAGVDMSRLSSSNVFSVFDVQPGSRGVSRVLRGAMKLGSSEG